MLTEHAARILMVLAVSVCGCAAPPSDVGEITVTTGVRIGDLIASDSTAVMLYRPSDCFSCFGVLSVWKRWSGNMLLVLTDHPTSVEARQLQQYRLGDYYVSSKRLSSWTVPSSHLFVNRTWIASGRVLPGRDPILDMLGLVERTREHDVPVASERRIGVGRVADPKW